MGKGGWGQWELAEAQSSHIINSVSYWVTLVYYGGSIRFFDSWFCTFFLLFLFHIHSFFLFIGRLESTFWLLRALLCSVFSSSSFYCCCCCCCRFLNHKSYQVNIIFRFSKIGFFFHFGHCGMYLNLSYVIICVKKTGKQKPYSNNILCFFFALCNTN